jgi:hypothetical protein
MQVVNPGLDDTPKVFKRTVNEMQIGAKICLHGSKVASNCDIAIAAVPYFKYSCGDGTIIENEVKAIAAFYKHFDNRRARCKRVRARRTLSEMQNRKSRNLIGTNFMSAT